MDAWASRGRSARTAGILDGLRAALIHDLDTPAAVTAVDSLATRGSAPAEGDLAGSRHSSASASDPRARVTT